MTRRGEGGRRLQTPNNSRADHPLSCIPSKRAPSHKLECQCSCCAACNDWTRCSSHMTNNEGCTTEVMLPPLLLLLLLLRLLPAPAGCCCCVPSLPPSLSASPPLNPGPPGHCHRGGHLHELWPQGAGRQVCLPPGKVPGQGPTGLSATDVTAGRDLRGAWAAAVWL